MSKLAFYAPMKSPTHPVPSGDREMAKGVFSALSGNAFNWSVELASELRLYDGAGDADVQTALKQQADKEIERLLGFSKTVNKNVDSNQKASKPWHAWITYHNYYKAPDLIGPAVSKALNIPYLLIEASIAKKRYQGRWAEFAKLGDAACLAADTIFYLTERDKDALQKHKPENQVLKHLSPFLNRLPDDLPPMAELNDSHLLAVGMHRPGDKLESYKTIAAALQHLKSPDWTLSIVGDGKAHKLVQGLFQPFGDKIEFCGELDPTQMMDKYLQSSIFLWPGVNEAFGMVYLEAQLAGLPVVAEDRPGVRDVIEVSESLVKPDSPQLMAAAVDQLISSIELRKKRGVRGRQAIVDRHLSDSATKSLISEIERLVIV